MSILPLKALLNRTEISLLHRKDDRNGGSSMDQHRNFVMREDLERLAAEDQRGAAIGPRLHR